MYCLFHTLLRPFRIALHIVGEIVEIVAAR